MANRILAPAAALLALVVAGYTGAAWYTGKRIEDNAGEQGKTLHKLLPFAAIDTLAYDRGIFSSDETLLVTLGTSPAGEPVGFTIYSKIRHLPLTGLISGTLVAIDSRISAKGAATSPFAIRTLLRYNGDGQTEISLPDMDSPQLSSNGVLFKIDFTQNMASYTFRGDIKKLTITGQSGVQTRLADLHLEGSQQRVFPDGPALYGGTSHLALGSFEIGAAGSPMTAMSIQLMTGDQAANFDKHNGLMDVSQKIGIQSAVFAGQDWGPAEFDISLNHIDARSLAALNQAFLGAGNQMDAAHSAEWLMASKPQLEEVLKHNPELRIERFSFTRPDGESSLSALFKFENIQPADLTTPAALLNKLHVTAAFKSPERDLATLAPRQAAISGLAGGNWLGAMLDAGYFARSNGYISSHMEYRNGNVWLNGKPYQRPIVALNAPAYRPVPPLGVAAHEIASPPPRPIPHVSVPSTPEPEESAPRQQRRAWGINRCVDSQGRTTFTDGSCPAGSR